MNALLFPDARPNAGFALIETLVAVLVLAFGLLGLAGLQTTGLRSTQSAALRSDATHSAGEIADRMRANPEGMTAGHYDSREGSSDDCRAMACDAAQMAGYDLKQWRTDLATRLPGGTGAVCRDGTPDDGSPDAPACDGSGTVYAIKIWWDDDRTDHPETYRRFVTSLQP